MIREVQYSLLPNVFHKEKKPKETSKNGIAGLHWLYYSIYQRAVNVNFFASKFRDRAMNYLWKFVVVIILCPVIVV